MALGRADLFAYFDTLGIASTTYEHRAVFTVAESHDVKAQLPGGHSKNLLLKDKKDRLFLVVAEGDAAIDLKSIHEKIGGSGRVTFAKPDVMLELLGVTPGSVTPFGLINDTEPRITVVLDEVMMRHDILNFHPLENTATTSVAAGDLIKFLRATGHEPLVVPVSNGKVVIEPTGH
ncbi:MAG: YbaK/EbsC family protein [Ancalomicrobiaceae bacterium]|nr:YbaK/EbsC family protein [Ancalomicrobiaceae bacterium]